MNNSAQKMAFITGGAGGLGGATARYLVEKGWHVFVADYDRNLLAKLDGQKGMSVVEVDVTSAQSVQKAVDIVSVQTDGLDAVVNFAGILALGSMVEMEEALLQRVFDVNVLGTFRVNKAFFPLLRARKGRIVNISSETGWQSGAPFNGAYGSSKHAIECYSDALRRELALLDMPVIKVQPGPFRTDMVGSIVPQFDRAIGSSTLFKDRLARVRDLAAGEQEKANDPRILAHTVYTALTVRKPKAAYSVKPDPSRVFLDKLPTRTADWILKKVLQSG